MALKFGTSGVRGLVSDMTDKDCYLYTLAFLHYVRSKSSLQRVAIAGDYRSSTPRIMRAVAFAVKSEGLSLDNCGYIPTPALVNFSMRKNSPGIMITGSHIPDDRNGIKFNLPWGEVLKEDEVTITKNYEELLQKDEEQRRKDSYPFDEAGAFRKEAIIKVDNINPEPLKEYAARYLTYFAPETLRGLKIVNYQHSAVARDIFPDILTRLGAQVIDVGRSDTFIPVDTEAVEHPQDLKKWIQEYKADALVSSDGDSDRPLLVDELGQIVRGDILGILVSRFLNAESVAAPVSCNTALELSHYFPNTQRTRIGSPYVIEAMNLAKKSEKKKIVGYEANGGFLVASDFTCGTSGSILKALPTRDALLPILSILALSKERDLPISKLVAELPQRFTFSGLLRQFPSKQGKEIVELFKSGQLEFATNCLSSHFGAVQSLDFTDGARITLASGDVIHFRPSGNAPEFRCYSESTSSEFAQKINERALRLIKEGATSEFLTKKHGRSSKSSVGEIQRLTNIKIMNKAAAAGIGTDIVIVSTTSNFQEQFWQQRLEKTRGQITNEDALILAVHEDWPGGAGNGLGTLYALSKANEKAQNLFDVNILKKLSEGASIGLYHTAGKGTRLAPLPGSEVNNKPGVKLPGLVMIDGAIRPITLLESVIKQTSIYAASRRGRISVFWGDQVFIPSVDVHYNPVHHVDILCQLSKMPEPDEWTKKGLEKYGLIAVGADKNASQVEKISHETAMRLIKEGAISAEGGIGISIGSFSISSTMAQMLILEFRDELSRKKGKFDADPHFWMPLTLNQRTYLEMMSHKGEDPKTSLPHYIRMQDFKQRFNSSRKDARIFGAVDIGAESFWWDYGNIKAFLENSRKLMASNHEAEAMRQFFNITDPLFLSTLGKELVTENSYIINSNIQKGKVKNSLIIGANVDHLEVEDCVLIMTTAPKIVAKASLLYNLLDDKDLKFSENSVRVDCMLSESKRYTMLTTVERDGGKDWKVTLPANDISYEELHDLNQNIDIAGVEALSMKKHKIAARKLESASK